MKHGYMIFETFILANRCDGFEISREADEWDDGERDQIRNVGCSELFSKTCSLDFFFSVKPLRSKAL